MLYSVGELCVLCVLCIALDGVPWQNIVYVIGHRSSTVHIRVVWFRSSPVAIYSDL